MLVAARGPLGAGTLAAPSEIHDSLPPNFLHVRLADGDDLNTQPGDSARSCGDCLDDLAATGWRLACPVEGHSWRAREGGPGRRIDLAFHTPALRCDGVAYSWDFQALDDLASSGRVGLPDHAMLLLDVVPA